MKQKVRFRDLGVIGFEKAWQIQTDHVSALVELKRKCMRNPDLVYKPNHQLLFCEHSPVFTLGKSGKMEHLGLDENGLLEKGIKFFKINRGGDITYHGPGQLVVYPNFDLDYFFKDLHQYIRFLEEAIIRLLAGYGLKGIRIKDFTGVWLNDDNRYKKICAIGVHVSRWITMHGLAFNINPDLTHFDYITPCGIMDQNKSVTSLHAEIQKDCPITEIKLRLKSIFKELFDFEYTN